MKTTFTTSAAPQPAALLLERLYPQTVEKVWQAISQEEHISAWWGKALFTPQKDADFVLDKGNGIMHGHVLAAEAPYQLVYTFEDQSRPAAVVCWALDSVPEGTHVYLAHTGYDQPAPPDMETMQRDWLYFLGRLETYLEGM